MANHDQSNIDRVWHVIERVGICMMTTRFGGGLRARPLESRPDRDENVIWFLIVGHRSLLFVTTNRRSTNCFVPVHRAPGL